MSRDARRRGLVTLCTNACAPHNVGISDGTTTMLECGLAGVSDHAKCEQRQGTTGRLDDSSALQHGPPSWLDNIWTSNHSHKEDELPLSLTGQPDKDNGVRGFAHDATSRLVGSRRREPLFGATTCLLSESVTSASLESDWQWLQSRTLTGYN